MTPEVIITYIITLAPSITSILAMIIMVVKLLKQFKELKHQVSESNELKNIKEQLKAFAQDNYELKAIIKKLTNKIDKIKE